MESMQKPFQKELATVVLYRGKIYTAVQSTVPLIDMVEPKPAYGAQLMPTKHLTPYGQQRAAQ